jgi:CBS domain-containing protein
MNNSIAERIASFLKAYKPFNYLSFEDLKKISGTIRVINLEKDKTLFQINDSLHDSFYVLHSGVIHLTVISDAEESLLNKCYPGDIFGLRPFFAKNNYQMTAKAREESIVYAIPIETIKPLVVQNAEVLNFLLESFAANSKSSSDKENANKILSEGFGLSDNQADVSYFQTLTYNKNPVTVSKEGSIKEVAVLMSDNLIESALIVENNLAIGIVTDCDFRSKVATGKYAIESTIDKIMTTPVLTVPENISLAEAQLVMITHNLNHLCVTEDGTDKTQIKGIISQNDLIKAQANNPGVLLKEIKRSQSAAELKHVRESLTDIIQTSISKNIPLNHINAIAGEVTLSIVRRAVEQAILELGSPPVHFAFLSIGSQGRKEQLLYTDHDNILVFEDVSAEKYRDVKDYFLQLAKKTTATLEQIGFSHCPFGHVANNTNYCKSLTDWIKQYNSWINTPGENTNENCTIFFDYELAFGEQSIETAITENIFKNAKNNTLFYDYLGNDALKKPTPLNFFKKFNLEEDGEHKGKFDIKTKGLLPLIECARLLVLSFGIKGINNTYQRFKQLAITDVSHSEVYLDCAEAFLTLSKFRANEGLKNDNTGEFIDIEELSKADKEKLKNALAPMRDLEELIKDKFQLTQFS